MPKQKQTPQVAPETVAAAEAFDINEWLTDAHLPEESVRIFKRADLISKINALRERIQDEHAAQELGGTLDTRKELRKLKAAYEQALEDFGASLLTVYVRAIPTSKSRKLRHENLDAEEAKLAAGEDRKRVREWANEEFIYGLAAVSVVGVAGPDGVRREVSWSADDLRKLETRIGPGQFGALVEARKRAEAQVQEPDADFLASLSGSDNAGGDD